MNPRQQHPVAPLDAAVWPPSVVNSPRIATPALSNAINAASILFNGSPKLAASFLSVIGPLTSSQP